MKTFSEFIVSSLVVLLGLSGAALTGSASDPPEMTYTALYTTGGPVPGAGSDPRIPGAALFTALYPPAINDAGQVAFRATWKAGSASGGGVFVDDALIVAVGDDAGLGGPVWKSFKDPVIGRSGGVAFLGAVTGTGVTTADDTAVAINFAGSGVQVIAREGAVAPTTEGATWKGFQSVSLAPRFAFPGEEPEELAFAAKLLIGSGSNAPTSANDSTIWSYDTFIGLRLCLREGKGGIKSFSWLKALAGSPGQGGQHFSIGGETTLLPATMDPHERWLIDATGHLGENEGGPVGSTMIPGALWKTFFPPQVGRWDNGSNALLAAMRATLMVGPGGVTSTAAGGIFLTGDGLIQTWEPVARQSGTAPGTDGFFSTFKDPVMAIDRPSVAFIGAVTGGTVTGANDTGIWWQPAGAALELVAREGDEPPAAPGTKWDHFTSLALPGGGTGPLLLAKLASGTTPVTTLDDVALYGVTSDGTLGELVREGVTAIAGKTVKGFTVLKALSGSPGTAHSFNAAGDVALLVTFTDASKAIVTVQVP